MASIGIKHEWRLMRHRYIKYLKGEKQRMDAEEALEHIVLEFTVLYYLLCQWRIVQIPRKILLILVPGISFYSSL